MAVSNAILPDNYGTVDGEVIITMTDALLQRNSRYWYRGREYRLFISVDTPAYGRTGSANKILRVGDRFRADWVLNDMLVGHLVVQ